MRGMEILQKQDMIRKANKNHWVIKSQSGKGEYEVTKTFIKGRDKSHMHDWACTCPDFTYRHMPCKHIYAVQLSLNLKEEVEAACFEDRTQPMESPILCPYCNGQNIIKRGSRKTAFGFIQRYGCKSCGHRFAVNKGFRNMKHDPKIITLTLDLFFKGVSLRKIADHLTQFYGVAVCQTTPMRWIRKYIKLLAQYAEKYKAETGRVWHSDETTIFIKKEGEQRYYQWIWNIMDSRTRYLLACQVTETRFMKDAQKALHTAKERTARRPDVIVTDGLQAYNDAVKREFYEPGAFIRNPHLRLKDFETKPNNNILERLNGTFREKTKVMRSLDSDVGAQEFVSGMQVYYNYIRPHQGIGGLTPAQMANIPIDLTGNRWEKMIGLAIK
jgi:transposase-like protein